ncbi:MAG: DNA polymerase III subunit beta [Gammaproteobacteria bacterium]|nr:DNA polymerase III subunit beta [Gammaproteobacteria bacterium]
MNLSIQRETLLKPLQLVIGVVERKQTLPILSNILLKTKDNKLSVTGTDLEVELIGQAALDLGGNENKQLTLPGRKLVDICKSLPDGATIELHQERERVILRCGRSRFTLSTLPAADFPNVEDQDSSCQFKIQQKDLCYLLNRCYFAMAQQDVRYYLNGILLEISPDTLRAVATDGHRLATTVVKANINVDHQLQVIVPRKGILELMRVLDDSDTEVEIKLGTNYIQVIGDDYTFTSKLIDGRFPDYNRVIPKNGDKILIIDRDQLKTTLHRTAILSNEKFRGLRFELRHNLLRIIANNPEQEVAEEELVVDYDNDEIDIGFNVNYIIDVLNTLKPGNVKLVFVDANSSMLIQESETVDESTFVVMPMRL